MARGYLERGVRTSCDHQREFVAQQSNARCVRGRVKKGVYDTHSSETSIGEGAFGYDFGALEGADNKFAKSFAGLAYGSLPF